MKQQKTKQSTSWWTVQAMRFTQANYNQAVQWSQLRSAIFVVSLRAFYHKKRSTPQAH